MTRWYWLLDLEFAGQTLRLSTDEVDVESDGGTLHYVAALQDVGLSEALSLLDSQLNQASVSVSALLPVDVPALVAQGHVLDGAMGSLALWREGDTYEQRSVRLVGVVESPIYGAAHEPVDFTLSDELWASDVEIPAPGLEVNGTTWPDSLSFVATVDYASSLVPEDLNLAYPVVFGRPGHTQGLSSPAWSGSIAVHLSRDQGTALGQGTPGPHIILAGHRVMADSVYLFTEAVSNETWDYYKGGFSASDPQDNGFAIEHWTDANGNTVAVAVGAATGDANGGTTLVNGMEVCTLGANFVSVSLSDDSYRNSDDGNNGTLYVPIYVGWYDRTRGDYGGGMVGADGMLVRGAGDVLEYLLAQTGLPVDYGRCAASRDRLNEFKIDVAIDERTKIWEWIQANLLPILPVSLATGPQGLYYVAWRWDATAADARWTLDADTDPTVQRAGRVKADTSKIANRIRVDFCKDRRTGNFLQYRAVDATYDTATPSVRASYHCAVSQARYRTARDSGVREKTIAADAVWDAATADAIAAVHARAYALAQVTVDYVLPIDGYAGIERGDVVLLSDTEVGMSAQVCMVQEVQWDTSGTIGVSLLVIPDPARDMRHA